MGAWDPAILTSEDSFSSALGAGNASGGRNYLAVDLDGDGAQEMISLNFNTTGYDRMSQELGGRVLSPDNNIHQMTTFKLS